jgi:hypothetical protein
VQFAVGERTGAGKVFHGVMAVAHGLKGVAHAGELERALKKEDIVRFVFRVEDGAWLLQ